MPKKEVKAVIKLQCKGGQATPAPPVGPALGQHGVNIGAFVKAFNDQTHDAAGMVLPVEITVYADRSFSFVTKSPPASVLLKKAANVTKGSGNVPIIKVGTVTKAQVANIAQTKFNDLNAHDEEAAFKMIAGTARSIGLDIVD